MRNKLAIIVAVVVLVAVAAIWKLNKSSKQTVTTGSQPSVRVLPVSSNPIQDSGQQTGLVIKSAAAEDNTDPVTKQAIGDRLQITLENTSTQTIANVEVYYTMKDKKTGQTESYYQKLTGFSLAPNEIRTVAFDNETMAGHYPENKYSLYRSSHNEVEFTIQVSAPGFRSATGSAHKSAGTGETAG